ncbi:glucosaminidase domain-containing protein [Gilvimarinus sp. DA14]|uniref:glucosaminidase domain-containing protein n=1 Tax=Gilvimarinus sp. DA14 TaxID=2956798 RepID=UPI0020B7CB70|nr:glucosaminidase domain-containing protein [Gilvimarinus sp. DA14]UTF61446.1 glucosaminidase domain-containing protein [Gilvimarinus sp. DA14]
MKLILCTGLLVLSFFADAKDLLDDASDGENNTQYFFVNGYQDLLRLFGDLGYTKEAWLEGDRGIPRLYIADIPQRWSSHTSQKITVDLKKRLFFRLLLPLVLRSNEIILNDRKKLLRLAEQKSLNTEQQQWLTQTAQAYDVAEGDTSQSAVINQLLKRVDTLPPSLVLAQAAEESGWGTSRFAFAGNALFGQWTWSGEGIAPQNRRSGKGDYKIASFASPLQSVQAHARNLNTHHAYRPFRERRKSYREQNRPFDGSSAAETLTRYSERGPAYVKTLHSLIEFNNLQGTDTATLMSSPALVLMLQHSE